ncbi:MAG: hypothetical protein RLZZ244_277, partial [Verrucomicrobiota bacterium]
SKGQAQGKELAKHVQAWLLPQPSKDKQGNPIPWDSKNVTPDLLGKAQRIPLEFIPSEDTPPSSEVFAFRLQPLETEQPLWIQIPKMTPAPGGFVTPEDFTALVKVPEFPREAWISGRGGILALHGERKLHIQSRGFDHLGFGLARVPESKINLFASQARGSFDSPTFTGNFSLDDIAHFSESVQPVPRKNRYDATPSEFDFGPILASKNVQRGLFYLQVVGVRPRLPEDGPADPHDSSPDWIALSSPPSTRQPSNSSTSRSRSFRYSNGDEDSREESEPSRTNTPWSTQHEVKEADARLVLVTDLALIVKSNPDGTRDVFVQSFQNQTPVEGVRLTPVSRNGEPLLEVLTDAHGHAVLPSLSGLQGPKEPVALLARKAEDLSFLAWDRAERRVQTSRFDVGGIQSSDQNALNAFLFTERGIYRPGDSIQLGAIVRQRDWKGDLTGLPLEAVLFNAKDEPAGTFPLKLPADGFLTLTLPTAETAPTGVWRIQLQLPSAGNGNALGQVLVRVEEFQPDRLKMRAHFGSEEPLQWRSPENLRVHAELQTLFGIPAATRRITAKMRLTPAQPNFSQWPDWTFGIPKGPQLEGKTVDLGESETDESGRAQFALALEDQLAPLFRVSVELEAFEADGGRGVVVTPGTLVSRHPYLLGFKADGDTQVLPARAQRSIQVSAIDASENRVPAEGLRRVLIETRHASILTKQENGTLAYVSQSIDKVLETADGSLPPAGMRLELPTQTPGQFRYEWRNASGVPLLSVPFTVVGSGDTTRNLERSTELQITLPNKTWVAGEEMELSIQAPFAGAGLITIERDKVLAFQWFKSAKSASTQRIRVPEGIDDGAYVHVTFVRGLDSRDIFTNPLSSGIVPFRISPERRTLPVQLKVPEKARPGDRLKIAYSTQRPARILIWAVDEGIHRVTDYQLPQPLSRLLSKPALEVQTFQLADLLIPEFTLLQNAMATGGDGDEEGAAELKAGLNPFKRKRQAPVVFWSGVLPSGPEPREIEYQIPDYFAGGLNLMAIALDTESVGAVQTHAVVKGPFVLTPSAPFFAAPGDEFSASLTVANQLEGAAPTNQILVRAETTGGIEWIEKPAELVQIEPNKESTMHFRFRATTALGNAEIRFSAQAGSERVDQRATLSVRPAVPRTSVVQSGWFRSDSLDVPINHPLHPEFSNREATVSTTPLGLARGLAAYLREYPFGCSEQITSRAFPWLVLRDDTNFGLPKDEAAKAIESAIAQLARRQGPNGGFGYWYSNSVEGFDYLSLYVVHFLTEARANGFHVPESLFQSALRRIRFMADADLSEPYRDSWGVMRYDHTRSDASMRAAAIYLLTRNEELTTQYAIRLLDAVHSKVPDALWHQDSSAVWLAATWRLLKKETEASRLIQAHLAAASKPRSREDEFFRYYESPLTEEATRFTVLCRHFPEIASKFGYDELRPITEMVEKGRFHTLSAAWSVLALKAYAALSRTSGVRAGIAQGGTPPQTLAEPRSGMVSARLQPGVAHFFLQRDSNSTLGAWYQTVETGFERVLPTEPESRSLDVTREWFSESEEGTDSAKVGDTLLARITVRNTGKLPQPNLALSELLPGGFDFAPSHAPHAIKPGLQTVAGTDYVDLREDRALLFFALQPGETKSFTYSVRPTCAGTFSVPPAFAQSMYDRAVFARGVASKFTVLPRE